MIEEICCHFISIVNNFLVNTCSVKNKTKQEKKKKWVERKKTKKKKFEE